ncbi:ATP-binding protein [Sporosarcina sp. Marseille-Q4063]|uniref:ATP-binding protein n=1 Tax=Sporosarcina sp. Marseille-Q4063 TaxID=2810514 RepID=UPI0020168569|nr:ATP-binding protein [Sporosarcina sp. Marseille-Q4063]
MKQEKASKFMMFFENARKPAAILDISGEIIQLNDEFKEKFGMEKINNIKDLSDEKSIYLWDENLELTINDGHTSSNLPIVLEPQKIADSVRVHLIYCDNSRRIIALFNVPELLSEESEVSNLKIFQKSESLFIAFDQTGIIQNVNEHSYSFLELSGKMLIGKSACEFFSSLGFSKEQSTKFIRKVIGEGYAETLHAYEKSSGEVSYYHIKTYYDESVGMFITRMADRTEKVILEKRLAHKESLYEVGQLAASIAHEIRNPITTLKGFTQLLRNSTAEESEKYLTVIDDEIIRMESILNEMLILSKPSIEEKTFISLSKLLSTMIKLFQPKARIEGISIIQFSGDLEEVFIFGDEAKLKQVMLNLMKNGLEAMSHGGKLTISLEAIEDNKVNVLVSDTGQGMSATQLKQIFMPFFTTRSDGTGLGLPFVIKTIEEHGGTVSVSSEVGVGSEFILSFPSATIHNSPSKEAKAKALQAGAAR